MITLGRVCMKIAGRDAGKLGIVVEVIDDNFVVLEGEVRRRKVNIRHIEPTKNFVEIKKGANKKECLSALGIKEEKTKSKEKKEKGPRPKRMHVNKKTPKEAEPKKKKVKKAKEK